MKVKIEQKHIDAGEICNSERCPIGLALSSMGYDSSVCSEWINIYYINEVNGVPNYRKYKSPENVAKFVYKYDRNYHVEPFTFELPIEDIPVKKN